MKAQIMSIKRSFSHLVQVKDCSWVWLKDRKRYIGHAAYVVFTIPGLNCDFQLKLRHFTFWFVGSHITHQILDIRYYNIIINKNKIESLKYSSKVPSDSHRTHLQAAATKSQNRLAVFKSNNTCSCRFSHHCSLFWLYSFYQNLICSFW